MSISGGSERPDVAIRVQRQRADGMSELHARAVLAGDLARAAGDRGEELLDRRACRFGVGRGDVECAVIVRARRERDAAGVARRDSVLLGEPLDAEPE